MDPLPALNEGDETPTLSEVMSVLDRGLTEEQLWALCRECCLTLEYVQDSQEMFQTLCVTPDTVAFDPRTGCVCFLDLDTDPDSFYVPPEYDDVGNSVKSHLFSLGMCLLFAANYEAGDQTEKPTHSDQLTELLSQLTFDDHSQRPELDTVLQLSQTALGDKNSQDVCLQLASSFPSFSAETVSDGETSSLLEVTQGLAAYLQSSSGLVRRHSPTLSQSSLPLPPPPPPQDMVRQRLQQDGRCDSKSSKESPRFPPSQRDGSISSASLSYLQIESESPVSPGRRYLDNWEKIDKSLRPCGNGLSPQGGGDQRKSGTSELCSPAMSAGSGVEGRGLVGVLGGDSGGEMEPDSVRSVSTTTSASSFLDDLASPRRGRFKPQRTLGYILEALGRHLEEKELWMLCREGISALQRKKKHLPAYISPDTVVIREEGGIAFKAIPEDKPLEVIFMAPELQQKGILSEKTCLYGLGVTLRCAAGRKYANDMGSACSKELENLVFTMLMSRAEKRPSLEEAMEFCKRNISSRGIPSRDVCQRLYEDAVATEGTGELNSSFDDTAPVTVDQSSQLTSQPPDPLPPSFQPIQPPVFQSPPQSSPQLQSPARLSAFVSSSGAAFRPIPIKPKSVELDSSSAREPQRVPSAFSSPATHFKPIVLQDVSSTESSAPQRESASDDREKEVMRKLKELKKNLMRHRPSNSSKDVEIKNREERTNSKATSKVSVEDRSDSGRKNSANSLLTGSQTGALEKLLGHLHSQGNLPDTQTLATAIAQYLQTLLGHNNSSKAGINMSTHLEPNEGEGEETLTPKTSEQSAQASLQNLQTQLSTLSLAAQNEPALIGQTINVPLQFGGNVVSSIPLRLQLQQDPQTGIIQLVPISLMQPQTPHLQHGSKSLPATPRAVSTQQSQFPGQGEEVASGRASAAPAPDLHTGSTVSSPQSQRGAQALLQKTAAMRSRNSQVLPNSGYWSDSGRHPRPNSIGGEVPSHRSNPDQSAEPLGYSPQGDQGMALGMYPRGPMVGDHSSPRLQGADRSPLADVAHRQNGRDPAGSASPSLSKDSGISGVNGSGQPNAGTHATLMDRLLSSEALNRQRVLGWVLLMLRSVFNSDDGYMENGAENLAVAEYIVSLTNLKWETFMSAVTEKYNEVFWSRDVLAGLYEVINGRPPSANSRILNTRTPPPSWSQADLDGSTRDPLRRQQSDPSTLDTPEAQSQPPRVGQGDTGSFSGTFPPYPDQARPKSIQHFPVSSSSFSRHLQITGVGTGEAVAVERVGKASESSDSECQEKKQRLKTRHELDRAKSSSTHNVSGQSGFSLAAEPEHEPWEHSQPVSDRAIRYDDSRSDSRKYGTNAASQAERRKLDDTASSPPIRPRSYLRSESDGPYAKALQTSDSELARRGGAYDSYPRASTVPRQGSLKRSSEPLLLEQGSQSSREPDTSTKGDKSGAAEIEHSQDSLDRGSTKLHYSLSIHHQKERCLGKPPSGYRRNSGTIQGGDGRSHCSENTRAGGVSGQDGALERREGIPEELPPFKSRCAIIHHWATMQHEMTTELETFMHEIDETNKAAIEARLRAIDQQLAMEKRMRKKTQKFYQKLKEPIAKSGKDDQKSVSSQVLKDLTEMTKKIRFLELCKNHLEMLVAELYGLETCYLHNLSMCGGRNQALQLQPYSDKHILQFQYLKEHHACEIQVLQAGEPDGLLAYLFTSSALSDGYIHQFLYCFRYFITSSHLFYFVHDRYLAALRGNQADMNLLRVQRRAVDLIHFWLEGFYIVDFEKDPELLKKLAHFVLKEIKTPSDNLGNLQVLVHTCLQGQQTPHDSDKDDKYFVHLDASKKQSSTGHSVEWGALTPMSRSKDGLGRPKSMVLMGGLKAGQDGEEESMTPRPTRRSDTFNILDFTPHTLVEQLTLVEQELFQMTHPVHYLNSRAQGIDVSNTVPGLRTPSMPRRKPVADNASLFVGEQCFDSLLQRIISHAQEVAHWVTAEIVSCSSQKTQVAVLTHFLSAAQLCLEVNNFATGLAITDGLDHLIVRQLPAWKVLPSKYSAIMDVLVANKIKIKSSPVCLVKDRDCLFYPTIPSVFYFLVHIQQREHGSYRLANGMVKWTKMRQIAELCDQIRIFQEHEYIFEPAYELQDALTQRIVEFSSQDLHTIAAQNDTNYRKISGGGIQSVFKKVKDKLQSK